MLLCPKVLFSPLVLLRTTASTELENLAAGGRPTVDLDRLASLGKEAREASSQNAQDHSSLPVLSDPALERHIQQMQEARLKAPQTASQMGHTTNASDVSLIRAGSSGAKGPSATMSDIVDGRHGAEVLVVDGSVAADDAKSAGPADAVADGAGGQGLHAAEVAAPGTEERFDVNVAGEARQGVLPSGGAALDTMVTHSMVRLDHCMFANHCSTVLLRWSPVSFTLSSHLWSF